MPTLTATKDEARARDAANKFKDYWQRMDAVEAQMLLMVDKAETDDGRDFTDEEKIKYDELKGERARLKTAAQRCEEILEMKAEHRQRHGEPEEPEAGGRAVPPEDPSDRHDPDAQAKKGPFRSLNAQLKAVRLHVDHVNHPGLQQLQAATGMGGSVDSEGGHFVQRDFADVLLSKMHETGRILRQRPGLRRYSVGPGRDGMKFRVVDESSRADGSRGGGVRAYWVGETGEPEPTMPKTRVIDMGLKKLAASVYVTDEQLQDTGSSLEQFIRDEFGKELSFMLENAIINGDGAGKPLGVMSSGALKTNLKEGAGNGAGTFLVENLAGMWSLLHGASEETSVWLHNRGLLKALITLKIGDHQVYLPQGTVATPMFSTLMGRPAFSAEYLPALGTKGDMLLFDLNEYILLEKEGIQAASSIHVRFLQHETAFRFLLRVDGQPTWNKVLTGFDGVTRSPYVVTETRT
ncbi:MAG: phage major capsid protein [Candidatus Nanopelagicales bacterium]|nr:phage major capsid protein [Candidatus Nanopelagicales bacterium]